VIVKDALNVSGLHQRLQTARLRRLDFSQALPQLRLDVGQPQRGIERLFRVGLGRDASTLAREIPGNLHAGGPRRERGQVLLARAAGQHRMSREVFRHRHGHRNPQR